MHHVQSPLLRAHVVQAEFHKVRGEYSPAVVETIDTLPACITDLIADNRPAEAEHYLRSAEALVGVITHDQFQDYMARVDRDPDDQSWT